MEKVPTNPNAIRFMARNKKTNETECVLLICFVNRYVDVLPERNLEGGSQESWSFDDVELKMIKL